MVNLRTDFRLWYAGLFRSGGLFNSACCQLRDSSFADPGGVFADGGSFATGYEDYLLLFCRLSPARPEQRRRELTRCRSLHTPVVVMDTPYRLTALLEDVSKTFGRGQWILIAFDLTLPTEKVYRGEVGDVLKEIGGKKGEFVLVIGR